jgi:hypothetical protein
MTISLPTKLPGTVTMYKQELDGEPGYMLNLGSIQAWITEANADAIGRYVLFGELPPGQLAPAPAPSLAASSETEAEESEPSDG